MTKVNSFKNREHRTIGKLLNNSTSWFVSKDYWAGYFLFLSLNFPILYFCFVTLPKWLGRGSSATLHILGNISLSHFMFFGWVPLLFFIGLILNKNCGRSEKSLKTLLLIGASSLSLYVGISSFFIQYADFTQGQTSFLKSCPGCVINSGGSFSNKSHKEQ